MRVIFLAAGKGERIFSHFRINKPLIKIGDRSLLENLIIGVHKKKMNKISVVVGYKKKNILTALNKYKNIDFISNKKFNTTDMTHSLMMGLKKYKDNILFSYSDIIYENTIFNKFKKNNNKQIIIPYLKNWKKVWKIRKKSIYKDAETFEFDNNKFLKEIGKKIIDKKKVQGQFMGLIYIPKNLVRNILKIYQDNFKDKKIQTTQFLQFLLKKKFKIKCIEYKGDWYEIDDYQDYKFFITNNDFKRINRNFKF
tara:strand:- start:1875 stop:2633 length:759 start_codon:yes stop_codon:yes gene_type:complete